MTADIRTAGAASHAAEGWHTINWKSAYRIVCRLQARIVKAIQEGRWGKVCTFPEVGDSSGVPGVTRPFQMRRLSPHAVVG